MNLRHPKPSMHSCATLGSQESRGRRRQSTQRTPCLKASPILRVFEAHLSEFQYPLHPLPLPPLRSPPLLPLWSNIGQSISLQGRTKPYHLVQVHPTGPCPQVRPTVSNKSVNLTIHGIRENLHWHRLLLEVHQRRHRTMDDCIRPREVYPSLQDENPTEHCSKR